MSGTTLRSLYEDFRLDRENADRSPKTLEFYDQRLLPFLEWAEKHNITCEDLSSRHINRHQKLERERGLSASTLHGNARALKAFVRYGHREGDLPAIEVTMPKLPKPKAETHYLTDEEVEALFSMIDAGRTDRNRERDRAILSLFLDSGVRKSEMVALNWGDIEWHSDYGDEGIGTVKVRNGKGDKERTALFGRTTWEYLEAYRATIEFDGDDNPLFQSSQLFCWDPATKEITALDDRARGSKDLRRTIGRRKAYAAD